MWQQISQEIRTRAKNGLCLAMRAERLFPENTKLTLNEFHCHQDAPRGQDNNVTAKNKQQPIVCGTDFSPTATEAGEIAAAIARKLGTNLVLVHVDEFWGMAPVDPALFEAAFSQKGAGLRQEAERLRKAGTTVEEKLLSGSAFDELVTAATKSNGRLIVMGALGHTLARRLLAGSVAERTAETSPIPTLVVRPGGRLGSWIRGEHVLKILVGYDFSPASDAALIWVKQLREVGKLQTNVLHSTWPPAETRHQQDKRPVAAAADPRELQKNLERDLEKRVAKFLPSKEATMIVEVGWGNPEDYLFETVNRERVDLIVVGTHQRRGVDRLLLGSVSRAVLHHAKVTVAVVPSAKASMRKKAT